MRLRCRWLIILAGVGMMVVRGGLPLGIDFSGGTLVTLRVRAADERRQPSAARSHGIPGEKVVQQYGAAAPTR